MSIPAAVQTLIDGSGNTFHAKVARWFIDEGWFITVSPYYMDETQQKARELDLVAEKFFPALNMFDQPRGSVSVRLFVECKWVATPSVFWFTKKNTQAVEALVCSTGGFRPNNTYTASHHYLASSPRVAKLFASSNVRGPDSDPIYKALNQSLNGLVALREQFSPASGKREFAPVIQRFNFPVVVCSSFCNLFAADLDGQLDAAQISDNFQMEIQYAYTKSAKSNDELFLLDFVEFDRLPQFVEAVKRDAVTSAFLLKAA